MTSLVVVPAVILEAVEAVEVVVVAVVEDEDGCLDGMTKLRSFLVLFSADFFESSSLLPVDF